MQFMTMIRSVENQDIGDPPAALSEAMGAYAQEGARNGTLVFQGALKGSDAASIVSLVDGSIKVVDGPFTEAKELVGGFGIVEVHSKEEAIELTRRLVQIHADHWPEFTFTCEVREMEVFEAM